jgi:hypothetical protein
MEGRRVYLDPLWQLARKYGITAASHAQAWDAAFFMCNCHGDYRREEYFAV